MAPENETKPVEATYRETNASQAQTQAQQAPAPQQAPPVKAEAKAPAPVEAKAKPAAGDKKRMLKPKNTAELGLYYIVAGIACGVLAFAGNFVLGVVISPIIAFAIGLFIILIVHYVDLLQTYGV